MSTEQEDLEFPPYQHHSQTSFEAAEAIQSKTKRDRAKVLEFLKAKGDYGATDEEMQIALNMNGSTQRPRRVSLCNDKLVYDSLLTRKTLSQRNATVWKAV